MPTYRRVALEDRCQIQVYLERGETYSYIARQVGMDRSTICREVKRNQRGYGSYQSRWAEHLSKERGKRCRKRYKIEGSLEQEIVEKLRRDWSPEQIWLRFAHEGREGVRPQTIYHYLRRERPDLRPHLRRRRKRGAGRYLQRKSKRSHVRWIDQRPPIVEKRIRRGDWERDGMYVANRQQLLVCTDRRSRYTRITKMATGRPAQVTQLTQQLLHLGPRVFTVTNDNGNEFRDSSALPYPAYHCFPYKPQQRGTVENTIGLLRQYWSRKTDIDSITSADLQHIEDRLNLRPRKCLDAKTPYEVFYGQSVALVNGT